MLRKIQSLLAWLLLCCRRSLTDTLAIGGVQRQSQVSVLDTVCLTGTSSCPHAVLSRESYFFLSLPRIGTL